MVVVGKTHKYYSTMSSSQAVSQQPKDVEIIDLISDDEEDDSTFVADDHHPHNNNGSRPRNAVMAATAAAPPLAIVTSSSSNNNSSSGADMMVTIEEEEAFPPLAVTSAAGSTELTVEDTDDGGDEDGQKRSHRRRQKPNRFAESNYHEQTGKAFRCGTCDNCQKPDCGNCCNCSYNKRKNASLTCRMKLCLNPRAVRPPARVGRQQANTAQRASYREFETDDDDGEEEEEEEKGCGSCDQCRLPDCGECFKCLYKIAHGEFCGPCEKRKCLWTQMQGKTRTRETAPPLQEPVKKPKSGKMGDRRGGRCGACDNCHKEDCGDCYNCLYKKRNNRSIGACLMKPCLKFKYRAARFRSEPASRPTKKKRAKRRCGSCANCLKKDCGECSKCCHRKWHGVSNGACQFKPCLNLQYKTPLSQKGPTPAKTSVGKRQESSTAKEKPPERKQRKLGIGIEVMATENERTALATEWTGPDPVQGEKVAALWKNDGVSFPYPSALESTMLYLYTDRYSPPCL